jgi:hypothetical protein
VQLWKQDLHTISILDSIINVVDLPK